MATIKDLIEGLSGLDPDMPVHMIDDDECYNIGALIYDDNEHRLILYADKGVRKRAAPVFRVEAAKKVRERQ
jgi:hypothetical protein